MTLNERAWHLVEKIEAEAARLKVGVSKIGGARILDCGAKSEGSLAAGLALARVCMADLAEISLTPSPMPEISGPFVQVQTDHPVAACLASQYAGWQIKTDSYFAMGSGPMRAAAAREELFHHIPGKETSVCAVGVLETKKPPTEEVLAYLVERLPVNVEKLALLFAPASSLAGTVQVVARAVETALHKLHELKFDVTKIVSGFGVAPLPPVSKDELAAIGRTNDSILYGSQVTLWVRAEDSEIEAIGAQVPSASSRDYGSLFSELFTRYGDFYKIDPLLFSPAEVTFVNLKTGKQFSYGKRDPLLLNKSFKG